MLASLASFACLMLLPFGLRLLGVDLTSGFAFSLIIMALLSDAYTTKAALTRGFSESNISYNIVKELLSENQFLMVSTSVGVAVGLVLLAFFRVSWILLMFAFLYLIGPVSNSLALCLYSPDRT
jgi:hypothetical protein